LKLTIGKDLDKEDDELPQRRVSGQEAQEAFNREIEQRKRKERSQNRVLHGMVCTPNNPFWMKADLKGFLRQRLDVGGNESLLIPEVDIISQIGIFENDKKMEKNFLMGLVRLEDWISLIWLQLL
jgi:hypothetical protein